MKRAVSLCAITLVLSAAGAVMVLALPANTGELDCGSYVSPTDFHTRDTYTSAILSYDGPSEVSAIKLLPDELDSRARAADLAEARCAAELNLRRRLAVVLSAA